MASKVKEPSKAVSEWSGACSRSARVTSAQVDASQVLGGRLRARWDPSGCRGLFVHWFFKVGPGPGEIG